MFSGKAMNLSMFEIADNTIVVNAAQTHISLKLHVLTNGVHSIIKSNLNPAN